jgi:glycosyltransferase involved in cell wall biosynthesis
MKSPPITLRVAGCALGGPGYPNAINTLRLLKELPDIAIADSACWLPEDFHLWKLARGGLIQRIRGLLSLALGTVKAAGRLLVDYRRHDWLYMPYPSLPLLWLLSWLPAGWRPHCIVDAYITLWDTLYQDRQLGRPSGLLSRLLLRAEARALRAAEDIIVDTQANAEHLSHLYRVPRQRIHALPLAIDPQTLPSAVTAGQKNNKRIRVLFIGTFVPLQGTGVIAQAIATLGGRDDLEFVLIGDGQDAEEVAPLLEQLPHVTWLRGWQPAAVLADELARADICLGVFGGEGKAARVLPFKLYMALAAGKAIITQHRYSLPDGCPAIPALTCAASPAALAAAISALAGDPVRRKQQQLQAAAYFKQYLAPEQLSRRWQQLLTLQAD